MRAASTSPKTSGCSVSSSPMTSSFSQGVPNTSRAMCAVVTASFTEWQPAVLGSTRTPSARIRDQKPWPERSPPDSRRNGEYRGRGIARGPEQQSRSELGVVELQHSTPLHRRQHFDAIAFCERRARASVRGDELAVERRGYDAPAVAELGERRGEIMRLSLTPDAVDEDPHP